jgi:WD40 repeat protein
MSSISSTSLQLLWNDNSSFETGFLIERCEQNGVFATLTTTQANCTTYTDSQLDSTKEYQYRASAFTLTNNTKTPNPIRVSYFLPPIDAQTIRQYNGTYKVIQPSYDGSHLILGGNFSGNNGNGDFLFIDIAHPETIYWNTHGSNISCAAMSRDNIFVTTASDDNRLLLWYYYSWGSYVAVPLTKRVQKLVYSSLDTKFYGASEDNKIRCWNNPWNMGDGSLQFTTVALSDSITSLDVNSDGTLLVSASGSSINLWNISTGSLVYTFPSFAYSIGTMQCGPNNLVGISGNNSIQVIDLTTKTICFSATGYSNAINPFSFNGDGSLLFIGDNTNIEIWRMSDRQMAQKQDMHRSIIALFGAKYQNSIVTIDTKDAPTLTRNYYIAHYTWVSISQ